MDKVKIGAGRAHQLEGGEGRGADLTGSAFGLPAQWPAANNKKLTHKYPHMCTGMYPYYLSTG